MTGSRLIGIVAAIVAIGAVAYFVFPGVRTKMDEFHDKHMGWGNPEARKKDPVGFIDYSIKKLEDNSDAQTSLKIGGSRGDIEIKVGSDITLTLSGGKVSIKADVEIEGRTRFQIAHRRWCAP